MATLTAAYATEKHRWRLAVGLLGQLEQAERRQELVRQSEDADDRG